MILFPNAKINLGLYITEKRSDGFHNIETVFIPIPELSDILEIISLEQQEKPLKFSQSGLEIETDSNNNLCVKAYHLINQHVKLPKVAMHLHKQIPMGAGLGGGSADGAFALKMLNQLAENPLPNNKLASLALELGSDCPFFLENSPCFAGGRGEKLEPLLINLSNLYVALVNPNIHVNTGKAYGKSTPSPAPVDLRQLEKISLEKWKNLVSNDFEKVVFAEHHTIGEIKDKLYDLGAVYASMSGSGSTVYGIFKDKPDIGDLFNGMFTHVSKL